MSLQLNLDGAFDLNGIVIDCYLLECTAIYPSGLLHWFWHYRPIAPLSMALFSVSCSE